MDRFSRSAFVAAGDEARWVLCRDLERALEIHAADAAGFHRAVAAHVEALRAVGHELYSFDEGGDFEIWCPDWTRGAGGLTVEFHAAGPVVVSFHPRPDHVSDL